MKFKNYECAGSYLRRSGDFNIYDIALDDDEVEFLEKIVKYDREHSSFANTTVRELIHKCFELGFKAYKDDYVGEI